VEKNAGEIDMKRNYNDVIAALSLSKRKQCRGIAAAPSGFRNDLLAGFLLLFVFLLFSCGCSKPLVTAKVSEDVRYISDTVDTDRKGAFHAVRWALKVRGYPIAAENEADGTMTTAWVPAKSDSHALMLFGRYDFGVNGAYYQLDVRIEPQEGKTRISIGSRVKSVVADLKSTGIEERRVLTEAKDYLRTGEPEITNIGLEE
jgi:hypothetical protein